MSQLAKKMNKVRVALSYVDFNLRKSLMARFANHYESSDNAYLAAFATGLAAGIPLGEEYFQLGVQLIQKHEDSWIASSRAVVDVLKQMPQAIREGNNEVTILERAIAS